MEVALGIGVSVVTGMLKAANEEAELQRIRSNDRNRIHMAAMFGVMTAKELAEAAQKRERAIEAERHARERAMEAERHAIERAREARERQLLVNIIIFMSEIIAVLFYYIGYYQGENRILKMTMGWLPFTLGNN